MNVIYRIALFMLFLKTGRGVLGMGDAIVCGRSHIYPFSVFGTLYVGDHQHVPGMTYWAKRRRNEQQQRQVPYGESLIAERQKWHWNLQFNREGKNKSRHKILYRGL